jgi:hypothetical protein
MKIKIKTPSKYKNKLNRRAVGKLDPRDMSPQGLYWIVENRKLFVNEMDCES